MAGAAVGFGVLSPMTVATAHADDWWDVLNDNGNLSDNDTLNGNGSNNNFIGGEALIGNGNARQKVGWGTGNMVNPQGNGPLSPVVGGVAINAGATVGVGGLTSAIVTPIAGANGNTVGLTLGFSPATSLATDVGGAVGLGLGGYNGAVQAPLVAPVNIGAVVPIQVAAGGLVNLGGNKQYLTANENVGAAQGGTNTGEVNQAQTAGDASVNATNTQNATSSAEANDNVVESNQVAGKTAVGGAAESGTGGAASAGVNTNGNAAGNRSKNTGGANNSDDNGGDSSTGVGNNNNNNNGGDNNNSNSE
jgi:hypothetical protein